MILSFPGAVLPMLIPAGIGTPLPDDLCTPLEPEPRPEPDHGPLRIRCPRCHAEPGQPCDRRTLRAHPYHLARVEAAGVKP